jgi:cell division inhibitor SulA
MAATNQERSAKRNANRAAKGVEELRLLTMAGTRAALADLMAWHGIDQPGEAMTLLIHNLRALGPDGSASAFTVPRHKVEISENVARTLMVQGQREAAQLDATE